MFVRVNDCELAHIVCIRWPNTGGCEIGLRIPAYVDDTGLYTVFCVDNDGVRAIDDASSPIR